MQSTGCISLGRKYASIASTINISIWICVPGYKQRRFNPMEKRIYRFEGKNTWGFGGSHLLPAARPILNSIASLSLHLRTDGDPFTHGIDRLASGDAAGN